MLESLHYPDIIWLGLIFCKQCIIFLLYNNLDVLFELQNINFLFHHIVIKFAIVP
jgi:hypothetical protein